MSTQKQRGNIKNLKPFKPGQSGNPKGRPPKVKCIPDILGKILKEPLPKHLRDKIKSYYPEMDRDPTFLDGIMRVVVGKAIKGDSWAIQFIADRTEGKVKDVIEMNGGQRLELVEEIIDAEVVEGDNPESDDAH